MISEMMINGTGIDGVSTHNERSSLDFGLSHLIHGDCSPLFLYQYRQASTAWERLAKTFSSIIVSIQSRRSCSMVTLIRGLFSTIEYDFIIPENINIGVMNVTFIGLNPIGVTTNERRQPISGSYGASDDNEVGVPDDGEPFGAGGVPGVVHAGVAGSLCSRIGTGSGHTHEEGAVRHIGVRVPVMNGVVA